MAEKTEGTFSLDGLLQGKAESADALRSDLTGWAQHTTDSLGIRFDVETSGGSFQIMPDNQPVQVSRIGTPPDQHVIAAMEDLLSGLTPPQRASVESTFRSVEIQPGLEVQTVYMVRPDGTVQSQQRTVQAKTKAPPAPLSTREKLLFGGGALLLVALLVALSTLFVDYSQLYARLTGRGGPWDQQRTSIQTGHFEPYLKIESFQPRRGGTEARVVLARTALLPTSLKALSQQLQAQTPPSLAQRLTLESLARGYVRMELYGEKDAYLGSIEIRTAALRQKESIELLLKAPDRRPIHRAVLTW